MKRSSSASVVSDKGVVRSSSSSTTSQSVIFRSSSVSSGLESEPYLPTFNPFSHAAVKKRRHLKLAKIFVHSIPFVILFCAIVLWLFSDPVSGFVMVYVSSSLLSVGQQIGMELFLLQHYLIFLVGCCMGQLTSVNLQFGPESVYYTTEG